MAITLLFNFLSNYPSSHVPYPWQRVLDIPSNLLYYYHLETGLVIYDFRPFVNFGEGVFMENDIGFNFTDQEVCQQLNNDYENFLNAPSLLLFCCACSGKTYYGVVEQPIVRCPLCKCITMMSP
ncbi:hypothetical protein LR48_Vigan11g106600 [Vigna angularis]|uniref:Uncharacterized protein n=1 Tax=Phaseolus angularis TaxID=3914 RepID=A0A0L9VSW6_PHAAN|nr:hypothetical protein LR48_Vigan11g106600 [Vigna angularis]